MLETLTEKFETPADEIKARVRAIAGHYGPGETPRAIERAKRALGLGDLTSSKVKSYWYGAVRDVPSHHMDRARSLTMAANENWGRLPCAEIPRRVIALVAAIIARAPSSRLPRLGGASFC